MKTVIFGAIVTLFFFAAATQAEGIKNIEKPKKGGATYEKQVEVYLENAFLASFLAKPPKDRVEEIEELNALSDYYNKLIKEGIDPDKAFDFYYPQWDKLCIACITETLSKDWEESITAKNSKECAEILNSRDFMDGADAIVYKDPETGLTHDIKTIYEGSMHYPSLSATTTAPDGTSEEVVLRAPIFWRDEVAFYEKNGKLYHVSKNRAGTRFNIATFVPEYNHFKETCNISTTVKGHKITHGQKNPICHNVVAGTYQKYEEKYIHDLLSEESFDRYRQDMCDFSADKLFNIHDPELKQKANKRAQACYADEDVIHFRLGPEASGGVVGVLADYNNDDREDLLIFGSYSSGAGSGCGHEPLYIYDAKEKVARLITTGNPGEVYFHGNNTGQNYNISCRGGAQKVIKIDEIHYLLTTNKEGIEQLHKVTTRQDGLNDIEAICAFAPMLSYE